jgi:hypothetical protein
VQVAGSRYYSPGLGRWASRDPIGERGGAHLYAFALNVPVAHIDTLGLVSGFLWGKFSFWPPCTATECATIRTLITAGAFFFDLGPGSSEQLLWQHWLGGTGTDLVLDYSEFDPGMVSLGRQKVLIGMGARGAAGRLGCGASQWIGGTTSWSPAASHANAMISQYQERFAYSCRVSKQCDTSGCCKQVVADCSILASARDRTDFNDGWGPPVPGSDYWIPGGVFRIMDGAVNYCFEAGRAGGGRAKDFDISGKHFEPFSLRLECP